MSKSVEKNPLKGGSTNEYIKYTMKFAEILAGLYAVIVLLGTIIVTIKYQPQPQPNPYPKPKLPSEGMDNGVNWLK
jgi:hypothetical protein